MNIIPINKEYVTTQEAAMIKGVTTRAIIKSKEMYEYKVEPHPGGKRLLIKTESLINSMSVNKRLNLYSRFTPQELAEKKLMEDELSIYSNVPDWKRKKAEKYLALFHASEGLSGRELKLFIEEWNNNHPEYKTSLGSYYRELDKYKEGGIQALFAGYGINEGSTIIDQKDFDYFCSLYMKEGGPTLKSCWLETYGNRIKLSGGEILENYPSEASFYRLLKKRFPTQSIERARKGQRYWNRKYSAYAARDWGNVKAGQCWFSDHRQADQAVIKTMPPNVQEQIERLIKYEGEERSKPVFPWITFWADAKTKKMLSIFPHEEAPNSDHIFTSFYMAVLEYGLPDEIYIDNGKDYRSKDFAGGKRKITVTVDEIKTRSLMNYLSIEVHFSKPYRGQSKTIERTFRIMKEWLDKQMPGYRGGNVTERPEILQEEIKQSKLMDFYNYSELLTYFFENVINKFESEGAILNGKSPDQVWNEEFKIKRTVSKESLKLLCMRSSRDYSIGKNGIEFSRRHRLHYWGDWMIGLKGNKTKYYMRRDPKQFQFAWIFNSKTDEYVGLAELNAWKTAALAKTDLEKSQLQEVLRSQKAEEKIVNSFIPQTEISPREKIENLAAGIAATSQNTESESNIMSVFVRTSMDEVKQKEEEYQKTGTYGVDISKFIPKAQKAIIFTSLVDKEEYEKGNRK